MLEASCFWAKTRTSHKVWFQEHPHKWTLNTLLSGKECAATQPFEHPAAQTNPPGATNPAPSPAARARGSGAGQADVWLLGAFLGFLLSARPSGAGPAGGPGSWWMATQAVDGNAKSKNPHHLDNRVETMIGWYVQGHDHSRASGGAGFRPSAVGTTPRSKSNSKGGFRAHVPSKLPPPPENKCEAASFGAMSPF